jgi:hypothetical protein
MGYGVSCSRVLKEHEHERNHPKIVFRMGKKISVVQFRPLSFAAMLSLSRCTLRFSVSPSVPSPWC